MIKLQKVKPQDWKELGEIESQSESTLFKALTKEKDLREYLENSTVYYIIYKNEIAGSIGFELKENNIARLQGLNIYKRFRGKSLGTKAVEQLIDLINQHKISQIVLVVHPKNISAIITYLRNGFTVTNYMDKYFENTEPRIEMTKFQ